MTLSTRGRASTLATVAAVVLLACRAPSGGVEDDPALAGHGADAAAPHVPRPQSDANEPTTRTSDEPAEAAPPARDPAASVDTVPPAPSDPVDSTTAVGEPSPPSSKPSAPASEPAAKTCRRPSPRTTGPLRDLVGLDKAAVRRCLGEPERTSGSTWHYRWPQGCAYEVSRVVVRFARGKVASAHAKHEITGQHCGGDF